MHRDGVVVLILATFTGGILIQGCIGAGVLGSENRRYHTRISSIGMTCHIYNDLQHLIYGNCAFVQLALFSFVLIIFTIASAATSAALSV